MQLAGCGGAVAEWSKALAWKVSIRQNRIEGSNPSRSAKFLCTQMLTVTKNPAKPGKITGIGFSLPDFVLPKIAAFFRDEFRVER